jgi:hypothetical protein
VSGIGKFEHIGFVHSQTENGNSSGQLHYSFVDQQPLQSTTSHYRLAQEDLDGKITYSEVRLIRLADFNQSLIFPNPSKGSITIKRAEDGVMMNIQVIDRFGRVIRAYSGIKESSFSLNIDQPGLYAIRLRHPDKGEESIQWVLVH